MGALFNLALGNPDTDGHKNVVRSGFFHLFPDFLSHPRHSRGVDVGKQDDKFFPAIPAQHI